MNSPEFMDVHVEVDIGVHESHECIDILCREGWVDEAREVFPVTF